jgi:pimeloyl-ACP methyl ester carboxylesterase
VALFGEPGARIGYVVYEGPSADAPPLLLVHGFTASRASFDANLAGLRSHFRVITVELLGHGDSDAPEDPALYAPAPAVARLVGLIDHLGYERVLLCGHSLGGALALRAALDAPTRIGGLIVINSNSAAGDPAWVERARPSMVQMGARVRAEGTAFLKGTRLYPAQSRRLDERSRELLTRDFDLLQPAGVAGTAESLVVDVNCYARLGELAVPTLVILGDRDADFVANAPAFVARLPGEFVHTARMPGAGHAANIEQPEAFERIVLGFAAELGLVDAPKSARPGRGGGFAPLAMNVVGIGLVGVGIALLTMAILGRGGGSSLAAPPASPTPATVVQQVLGTRSAGPGIATQPLAASASATISPTATRPPSTATLSVTSTATAAATATPTRAAPTSTPPATPTPTQTPEPTATSTPTAVPTPPGPAAAISGASSVASGGTATFIDASRPPVDVQKRVWTVSGGAITVPQQNPAAFIVQFPGVGCYTVSLTVSFRGQASTYSTAHAVAVGNAVCQ